MKPHIKAVRSGWQCSGGGTVTFSTDYFEAYLLWVRAYERRRLQWQYVPPFDHWHALPEARRGLWHWLTGNKKPR